MERENHTGDIHLSLEELKALEQSLKTINLESVVTCYKLVFSANSELAARTISDLCSAEQQVGHDNVEKENTFSTLRRSRNTV